MFAIASSTLPASTFSYSASKTRTPGQPKLVKLSAPVYWIHEVAEYAEEAKLYEMLFQRSQELDVMQLPLKDARLRSRHMMDEVTGILKEDHTTRQEAVEKQYLAANGGRMPPGPELDVAAMPEGFPFQ